MGHSNEGRKRVGADEARSRLALGRQIDRHEDLISQMVTDMDALRREVDNDRKESKSRDASVREDWERARDVLRDAIPGIVAGSLRWGFKWLIRKAFRK